MSEEQNYAEYEMVNEPEFNLKEELENELNDLIDQKNIILNDIESYKQSRIDVITNSLNRIEKRTASEPGNKSMYEHLTELVESYESGDRVNIDVQQLDQQITNIQNQINEL